MSACNAKHGARASTAAGKAQVDTSPAARDATSDRAGLGRAATEESRERMRMGEARMEAAAGSGTARRNGREATAGVATGDEQVYVTWSAFVDARHARHGIAVWKDAANPSRTVSIDPVALLHNMCSEPKGEKDVLTIVKGFWASAGIHAMQCVSQVEHQPPQVTTAKQTVWKLPVQWLLLFLHFACSWKSANAKDEGEWFWDLYLRPPKRNSTVVALFKHIGLDFAQEMRACRHCLGAMHITDPACVILQPVPPLAVNINMRDGDGNAAVTPASIVAALTKESVEDLPSVQGQDTAIHAIANLIERRLLDPAPRKPAVVLMPGPAATGKTTTAEAVVRYIYGDDVWRDQRQRDLVFLRIDLNEYANESALTRLIGADAGYVMSDKSPGILIAWLQQIEDSQMTDRPISGVLLLDELEKAGKEAKVMQFLMSLAEYGSIAGANSHRAYIAKKLLIFCATNAGEKLLAAPYDEHETPAVSEQRKKQLDAELIEKCCSGQVSSFSRFDVIALFYGFSMEARRCVISNIARKRLKAMTDTHSHGAFTLSCDDSLIQRMEEEWSSEPTNGARSARTFCQLIENLMAQAARNIRTNPHLIQYEHPGPIPMEIIDAAAPPPGPPPVLQVRVRDDELQCVLDAAAQADVAVQPIARMRVRRIATHDRLPPLHTAAASGKLLSPQNIHPDDLNSLDSNGRTPLHHAAAAGHVETVRYLLSFGPNLLLKDRRPGHGFTALMLAVMACDGAEDGAAVERQLQRACEVITALLEHAEREDQAEALLNVQDDQGRTALLLAFDTHVTRVSASETAKAMWRKLVSIILACRMSGPNHPDDTTDLPSTSRCQLDEDTAHRGMLYRLLQYAHRTETPNAAEEHSFQSFFVEPALTDSNGASFDFDFLVTANCQLDAILKDPLLGGCSVCVCTVLRTLQKHRCVHELDACQNAVAGALMRWLQDRSALRSGSTEEDDAREQELARWTQGEIPSAAVLKRFFAHGFSVCWLYVDSLLNEEGPVLRRASMLRALNELLGNPGGEVVLLERIDRSVSGFGDVNAGNRGTCGTSMSREMCSAMKPVPSSPLDLFTMHALLDGRRCDLQLEYAGNATTLTQELLNELRTYLRLRQEQASFEVHPRTLHRLLPALLALHRPAPLPPPLSPVPQASRFSRPSPLVHVEPSVRERAQRSMRDSARQSVHRHEVEVQCLSDVLSMMLQSMKEPHQSYWSSQVPTELCRGFARHAASSDAVPAAASAAQPSAVTAITQDQARKCINAIGKEYIGKPMEDLACAVERTLGKKRPHGNVTYSEWRVFMNAINDSMYGTDKERPRKVIARPPASTGGQVGKQLSRTKRKATDSASSEQLDPTLSAGPPPAAAAAAVAPADAASSEEGLLLAVATAVDAAAASSDSTAVRRAPNAKKPKR